MPFINPASLNEKGLCALCEAGMIGFDASYSFGSYEGELRQLIHLFKYGKVESLAKPLSRLLETAVPLETRFDAVIAMPMHWRKEWERGFNQAELLARPVARRYGLALTRNLRRSRYTKSQAGLNESARWTNLKDSFAVVRREQIAGKRVLLVDDVLTTGSTLRAAAEALKAAGAAHVTCLTLARVDNGAPVCDSVSLAALQRAVQSGEPSSAIFASSTEDQTKRIMGPKVPAGMGVRNG